MLDQWSMVIHDDTRQSSSIHHDPSISINHWLPIEQSIVWLPIVISTCHVSTGFGREPRKEGLGPESLRSFLDACRGELVVNPAESWQIRSPQMVNPGWSRLILVGLGWSRLILVDPGWSWLILVDPSSGWSQLLPVDPGWFQADPGWSWLILVEPGWSRLILVDPGWSWLILVDPWFRLILVDPGWSWFILVDPGW